MTEILELLLRVGISIPIAFFAGKLMSKIKMPAILGWLLTGMILGPHALGVMNEELLNASWYHMASKIFECSFGIMLGKELVFKKMKRYGKQIMVTTIFESIGTFLVVSLCFGVIFTIMDVPFYVALIFGGIALATAPAPSLSIVNEFKTKGPVTDALIPIAMLDDVVAIIVFVGINSFVAAKGSAETGSMLSVILLMVLLPLAIGIAIGFAVCPFFKKQRSQKQNLVYTGLLIIATFIIGYFVDNVLLPVPSINYMLMGMAVFTTMANVIPQEKMDAVAKASNPIVGISILIMIMNLGAPLDYKLILGAGVLTAVYIISRGFGKYFSTRLGAKLTNSPMNVQKYLGLTLLPHSGVSLVFTGMAVTSLLPFDTESALLVQGTISAAAVINEVFAVIIAKKGFELAGEMDHLKANPTPTPEIITTTNKKVITISRQYGSGGREIATRLAQELNIPIYDKLLFAEISEKSNIPESFIADAESNSISPFSQIFDTAVNSVFIPSDNHSFTQQSMTILSLAQQGPCVIVGRGGNHILKDTCDLLSVYIYAEESKRINRIVNEYDVDGDRAKKLIHLTDKNRIAYIKTYTNENFGDAKNYHLCIDSGTIGIDEAVQLIKTSYLKS